MRVRLGRDIGHADQLLVPLGRRVLVEFAALGIGIAGHLGVGQHDVIGHGEIVEAHRLALRGDLRHGGDGGERAGVRQVETDLHDLCPPACG